MRMYFIWATKVNVCIYVDVPFSLVAQERVLCPEFQALNKLSSQTLIEQLVKAIKAKAGVL